MEGTMKNKNCKASTVLSIDIDFSEIAVRYISFNIHCNQSNITEMIFPLLANQNGIEFISIDLKINEKTSDINNHHNKDLKKDVLCNLCGNFSLNYKIKIKNEFPLGFDKNYSDSFIVPSINTETGDVFIGAGILPYPLNWSEIRDEVSLSVDGFNQEKYYLVSNILPGNNVESNYIKCSFLNDFFLYLGNKNNSEIIFDKLSFDTIDKQQANIKLCFANTKLKIDAFNKVKKYLFDYLMYLQDQLQASLRQKNIVILIMPVPTNYEQLSNNTFVSGCNMDNGVFINAPDVKMFLQRFGHENYLDFLYDGLTHEFLHFYTTGAASQYKSYLYSSSDCPRFMKSAIGEGLNCYFHYQYFYKHYHNNLELFITKRIIDPIRKTSGVTKHNYLWDWYFLDCYLKNHFQIPLLNVFKEMIQQTIQCGLKPYRDINFVIEISRKMLGEQYNSVESSGFMDFLLNDMEIDYNLLLEKK